MNKYTDISINRTDLYVIVAAGLFGWGLCFFLLGYIIGVSK